MRNSEEVRNVNTLLAPRQFSHLERYISQLINFALLPERKAILLCQLKLEQDRQWHAIRIK
jgi:hypothetical protein